MKLRRYTGFNGTGSEVLDGVQESGVTNAMECCDGLLIFRLAVSNYDVMTFGH